MKNNEILRTRRRQPGQESTAFQEQMPARLLERLRADAEFSFL